MNVNTLIKAAENGDLQKVIEYIDGGGKVDAKNEVSWANELIYESYLCELLTQLL